MKDKVSVLTKTNIILTNYIVLHATFTYDVHAGLIKKKLIDVLVFSIVCLLVIVFGFFVT